MQPLETELSRLPQEKQLPGDHDSTFLSAVRWAFAIHCL